MSRSPAPLSGIRPVRMPWVAACLALALLAGCAHVNRADDSGAVRDVTQNRFHSDLPEVALTVVPEFIYLGSVDSRDLFRAKQPNAPLPPRYVVSYIFVEPDNQRVRRAITLQILKADKPIDPYFFGDVKITLDTGECVVAGEKYKYYSQLTYPPSQNPLTRFILERGYRLNCGLSITAGRIVGPRGDYLFKLIYIEDLIYSGFSCSSYQRREAISPEQLTFLTEIIERFKAAFAK